MSRGAATIVLTLLVAGCASSAHPNPDPGGHVLGDLSYVVGAIPPGANIEQHQATEPQKDHCTISKRQGVMKVLVTSSF
jgi:hypothetical protein